MDRNVTELENKAKEAVEVLRELISMATEQDFGVDFDSDGSISFRDWQSSDCYGEGTGEDFTVNIDGNIWQSSNC